MLSEWTFVLHCKYTNNISFQKNFLITACELDRGNSPDPEPRESALSDLTLSWPTLNLDKAAHRLTIFLRLRKIFVYLY